MPSVLLKPVALFGSSQSIACPSCRAPIEVRVPSLAQSVEHTGYPDGRTGAIAALTPREREIFVLLDSQIGEWVHGKTIRQLIWGGYATAPTLATIVKRMRPKLATHGLAIESRQGYTLHGDHASGYRLIETDG